MKFKTNEESDFNKLYTEMRYNLNTCGTSLDVLSGKHNSSKRECGVTSIFSLMCYLGYYESIKNNQINMIPKKIVEKMFDNSENYVENVMLRNRGKEL